MSLLDAATGWLLFAGTALAVGSVGVRVLILPRMSGWADPVQGEAPSSVAELGRMASAALLLALALAFLRQLLEFRDPFAPLGEDVRLLLASAWGTTWLWSVPAATLALAAFWLAAAGRTWAWWAAVPAVLAVSAYPALTGHAAGEEGALGIVALLADVLHVLAAGAWIGGLAVVLHLERRHRRGSPETEPASLLPTLVPAFSPVAVVSVGTLMATGAFASWLHLDGLPALWTTGYGRLLSLKLLVVAATLALGAVNWRRLGPRLHEVGGPSALRRSAMVELLFANVVLLVTAILVRTSPMGH